MEIKGYKTAVRFSGGGMNISELAFQFLTKNPEIDVFVGINIGGGELGFRCIRDDLDTGGIFAKPMGGGGHPKASGCPLPETLIEEIRNKVMELVQNAS
jgi:oligoribonuclease NrnB/cAMP/cGMP phosphodiesterase (DHH superfamily)